VVDAAFGLLMKQRDIVTLRVWTRSNSFGMWWGLQVSNSGLDWTIW
jgi:hypothetical protein